MNQELTVSAKLPQFLIREAENVMNRNRELILLLRDNQICIDEEGKYIAELTKSFDEIRSISPYAKQFESILFKVIKHCKKRFSLNIEYSEINLCQKSVDKIYLVPEKPAKEIEQLSNSYNEITFCTGNNVFDIIKKLPFELHLEDGKVYDLPKILEPYARNSETLSIVDPYIHNSRALNQFKKIALQYNFNTITIKCGDLKKLKTKTGQPRDISEFKLFIQELKDNGVDVKFIYYDNNLSDSIGHKERYIIYDDVQIYIPGGLDIFDKNGRFQNTGEGFYLIFKKREIKLKGEPKSLL